MVNKCPHCASIVDRPMIFSLCQQRVFNYIWDHSNCTKADVEVGVYGRKLYSNVIHVHISKIRNTLRGTPYRLINVGKKYTIVDVSTPSTTKESVNASV